MDTQDSLTEGPSMASIGSTTIDAPPLPANDDEEQLMAAPTSVPLEFEVPALPQEETDGTEVPQDDAGYASDEEVSAVVEKLPALSDPSLATSFSEPQLLATPTASTTPVPKEVCDSMAQAVVHPYMATLDTLSNRLEELQATQSSLITVLVDEREKVTAIQPQLSDLIDTFSLLPKYTARNQAIRQEMRNLLNQTEKLRARSTKLLQRKTNDEQAEEAKRLAKEKQAKEQEDLLRAEKVASLGDE